MFICKSPDLNLVTGLDNRDCENIGQPHPHFEKNIIVSPFIWVKEVCPCQILRSIYSFTRLRLLIPCVEYYGVTRSNEWATWSNHVWKKQNTHTSLKRTRKRNSVIVNFVRINSPAVIRTPINSNLGWPEHSFPTSVSYFLLFWLKLWRHGNKF